MNGYNVTPSTTPTCGECNLTMSPAVYNSNAVAITVNVAVALFAVVSNAVVILTVAKTRRLHRPANILLCSLALNDLLVGLVVHPLLIALLIACNSCECRAYSTFYRAFSYVLPNIAVGSCVHVCVMCWDRYKAVSSPLEYRATVTNKKMLVISVLSWMAWLAIVQLTRLPPRFISRSIAVITLLSFVAICVVSQTATLKAMRRHGNQVAAATQSGNRFAREKKMAITLRWILTIFLLSVVPQLAFLPVIDVFGAMAPIVEVLRPWVRLALLSSSSLNPALYFWRHVAMRNPAKQLLKCCG